MSTRNMIPISCTSPPQRLDGAGVAEFVEQLHHREEQDHMSRFLGASTRSDDVLGQIRASASPAATQAAADHSEPQRRSRPAREQRHDTSAQRGARGTGRDRAAGSCIDMRIHEVLPPACRSAACRSGAAARRHPAEHRTAAGRPRATGRAGGSISSCVGASSPRRGTRGPRSPGPCARRPSGRSPARPPD